MKTYNVSTNYEYERTHRRSAVTIWSGDFCSDYEGSGFSLPKKDGFMLYMIDGRRIRVACPCPRATHNYQEVDSLICKAIAKSTEKAGTMNRKMYQVSGVVLEAVLAAHEILGRTFGRDEDGEWDDTREPEDSAADIVQALCDAQTLIQDAADEVGAIQQQESDS